jgi:hypothetical protein
VPKIAFLAARGSTAARAAAIAGAILFAVFVAAKGIPTLRHDWDWPIDRTAVPSFVNAATAGWLSDGMGTANPHPTGYLIALPLGAAMWLFGPLTALALLAAVIGYLCVRTASSAVLHWNAGPPAAIGLGLFALFNPWVYNEVVAGHLVMVLAYGALIGLFAEMLRGREASSVRLALWVALIEAQLQFFLLGTIALVAFAVTTRKWLPVALSAIVALPSMIGLLAERASLLHIPYSVEWQVNQSVWPLPLLALRGYFAGYADRLGIAAGVAVWLVFALAAAGSTALQRSRPALFAIVAAACIYAIVLGVHGPLAAPYAWIVRNVPESGVFRELYDLAGALAALVTMLAGAATARFRALGYVALAAGIALPISWAFAPPSDFWIAADRYPHPRVSAPPFTRAALMPAFQPLGLRGDGGDGADPDAFVRRDGVAVLNEYFPAYPVDMALASYEQSGDARPLRALGVSQVVARPWLVSRTRGGIGLAASSLKPAPNAFAGPLVRNLDGAMPLIAQCEAPRVVAFNARFGACDVFFGDDGDRSAIRAILAPSDSIDPRTAWIDARLAFAEDPALAQAFGGELTQSRLPAPVEPGSWLLAYVRGSLVATNLRPLSEAAGTFVWLHVPSSVTSVECLGLCELVAQAQSLPAVSLAGAPARVRTLPFRIFAPWLYVVELPRSSASARSDGLLRFNERYDRGWIAVSAFRVLRHVRVGMSVNGWFLGSGNRVVLVQVVAAAQLIGEVVGALCVCWLLKALASVPTKRAS